ncbi:MAG TPA: GntR family transcriptional regulator [Streptosporangiaceae bacterium]|nr:GntR family transcriptional regulator [Streptosporangiaceae bacterium]
MLSMSPRGGAATAGESAQDVTYRWLKRHIGSLPRHVGTFLTETEVAAAAQTSRTPVREALLRLEAEGFLQIMPKKGAFVPPISDDEVRAMMEARLLVEDWSVRRVTERGFDLSGELGSLLREQEDSLTDPVRFIDCDRAFHRAIITAAGNPVLADFYESLRDRQVRMGLRAVAASANRAQVVVAEHAAIAEAVRSGSGTRAAEALAAHLRSTLIALRLPDAAETMEHTLRTPPGG